MMWGEDTIGQIAKRSVAAASWEISDSVFVSGDSSCIDSIMCEESMCSTGRVDLNEWPLDKFLALFLAPPYCTVAAGLK